MNREKVLHIVDMNCLPNGKCKIKWGKWNKIEIKKKLLGRFDAMEVGFRFKLFSVDLN